MATPVLKIAKSGKDVSTAGDKDLALDSSKVLPKIYAIKKFTPSDSIISSSHGLTYPPMFLTYRETRYLHDNTSFPLFNPVRYTYENGLKSNYPDNTLKVDSSNYADDTWIGSDANRPHYVTFFLDPLKTPSSDPNPTTSSIPRLKIGANVATQADYKNRIDSKYQTLKVAKQGTLTANIPAKTTSLGADNNTIGSNQMNWYSTSHGLNYAPVFAPFGIPSIGLDLNLCYRAELGGIPSSFKVNDISNLMVENRYSTDFEEYENFERVFLYVDSSNIYIGYRRYTFSETEVTFPARTVTVDYTIFNNPITETFNLLD